MDIPGGPCSILSATCLACSKASRGMIRGLDAAKGDAAKGLRAAMDGDAGIRMLDRGEDIDMVAGRKSLAEGLPGAMDSVAEDKGLLRDDTPEAVDSDGNTAEPRLLIAMGLISTAFGVCMTVPFGVISVRADRGDCCRIVIGPVPHLRRNARAAAAAGDARVSARDIRAGCSGFDCASMLVNGGGARREIPGSVSELDGESSSMPPSPRRSWRGSTPPASCPSRKVAEPGINSGAFALSPVPAKASGVTPATSTGSKEGASALSLPFCET